MFLLNLMPLDVALCWTNLEVKDAVSLAVEESNNLFNLHLFDDKNSITEAILNSQKVIDMQIPVVIGHKESYITIPVSSAYEFGKVLLINTASTSSEIKKNYNYLYSLIPSDKEISKSIANYLKSRGFTRALVCCAENSYGMSFAKSLDEIFFDEDLSVVDKYSYIFGSKEEFQDLVENWENYRYDCAIFIGYKEEAINFASAAKRLHTEIIYSEAIADASIKDVPEMEGAVIPWLFYPRNLASQEFIVKFKNIYGREPNFIDALSYNAIKILEQAIAKVGLASKDIADFFKEGKYESFIQHNKIAMQRIDKSTLKYLGDF